MSSLEELKHDRVVGSSSIRGVKHFLHHGRGFNPNVIEKIMRCCKGRYAMVGSMKVDLSNKAIAINYKMSLD